MTPVDGVVEATDVAEIAIARDDDVVVRSQVAATSLIEIRGLIMRTGGPDAPASADDPLDDLTFRAWHELRAIEFDEHESPDQMVYLSAETAGVALRELSLLKPRSSGFPTPRRALLVTAFDELLDELTDDVDATPGEAVTDGGADVFRIEAEVEGEQTAGVLRDYIETKTHCTLTAFDAVDD